MAATTPRGRSLPFWPRAALAAMIGVLALASSAFAQLDPPSGIQVVPGCQQYVVTWNPVPGAISYRVHVEGEPTPIEVTDPTAVIPAPANPTDRAFRIGAVDVNNDEGTLSGLRQASGADLPFTLQGLSDITVHVGDVLSFMVSRVGEPGIPAPLTSYEWTRDGVPFVHNSSVYFTSTAQFSDAGLYHLRGCAACCDELDVVRVTVLPFAPPPPNFVNAQSACQGVTVTWDPVPGAVSYVVHRTGAPDVPVATNNYFDPLPVGVCRSYSVSSVDAFDQVGSTSGNTGQRCGVEPLPASLSLGADQFLRVGRPFSLSLPGTFNLATTTFDWRKNNVSLGAPNQPTFSITNVALGNSGSYTCVVSNVCGTVTSSAVVLTVVQPPPPPSSITATVTACRQVTVSWPPVAGALKYFVARSPALPGTPVPPLPPGVFVNGTSYVDTISPADSITNFTYQVASVGLGDVAGALSSFTTAVRAGATARPGNVLVGKTVETGANVLIHTIVTGTSAVWRKNGVPFAGGNQEQHFVGTNQLSVSLILNAVTPADAGSYDLQVCTACSCANTTAAVLNVCNTPVVTAPAQVFASEGQASVDLVATATNAISLQWYQAGIALPEGGHYTGTTSNTLTIHTPLTEDAGFYELRATGNCVTVSAPLVELKIDPCTAKPVVSQQPPSTQAVAFGSPAAITFATTCCRPPAYQWFRQEPDGEWLSIPGATSSTFSIPSFSASDIGSYFCIATNYNQSVLSRIANLTEFIAPPPPRFIQLGSFKFCSSARLVWGTNVPLSTTITVRRGSLTGPIEVTVPATGLVLNGSYDLPIPDATIRAVTIECRDAGGVLVLASNFYTWARPPGPSLVLRVSAQPDYVAMPFGTAVAVQVRVENFGCGAYTGDLTLTGIELAQLPSTAVFADGTPVAGHVIAPSEIGVNGGLTLPLIYFPVTPPGPGLRIGPDLTVVVGFTQPDVGSLTSVTSLEFTSGGVR